MGLFGKKKDEEELEDEEILSEEEELEDRKLTRKFKDLKPENKKKRKEPPKPWGKKERIIVLSFFLITTFLAAGMFLFSHNYKIPGLPRISIGEIDFRNPFGEETIQIGQKQNISQDDPKADEAISYFNDQIKPLAGLYAFKVVRLGDKTNYGVSVDDKIQGASILKLPLMVFVYKLSEEGKINLDTKYSLKEEDKIKGSGILSDQPNGTEVTYRKMVEYMGKNSDRTAYKIMKDIAGDKVYKQFVKDIGMNNTDVDTGMTTSSDISLVFSKLYDGQLINQKNKDELIGYIQNTIYEDWITAGVPSGIKVAHKFGQDVGVLVDGGIVYADKPYIIVLMGEGITQKEANILFPKISRKIYNIESNTK